MGLNFAFVLEQNARHAGQRLAAIDADGAWTYGEVDQRSSALAGTLVSLGLRPQARVVLCLPNSIGFTIGYFGILKAGGTIVAVNPLENVSELEALNRLCEPDFWLTSPELLSRHSRAGAEPRRTLLFGTGTRWTHPDASAADEGEPLELDLVDTPSDATAVIMVTSGSTGRPKAVELTHSNLFFANHSWAREMLGLMPEDRVLSALPLAHSYGMNGAHNSALYAGSSLVFTERFRAADVLEAIEAHGVTLVLAVTTMLVDFLRLAKASRRHDLSSWRLCVTGGAAAPPEVIRSFEGEYGVRILRGYGSSEMFRPISFFHDSLDGPMESVGRSAYGTTIRIVNGRGEEVRRGEIGELLVRSPSVAKGYYRDPDLTSRVLSNGWFRTEDLGWMDGQGFVFIVGRIKHTILRGGYTVYPQEVEAILYQHPAIFEAVVFGVADARLGEEVKAAVVLKPSASVTEEELQSFCRERLASYKYPRIVEFCKSLPRGQSGKHERPRAS